MNLIFFPVANVLLFDKTEFAESAAVPVMYWVVLAAVAALMIVGLRQINVTKNRNSFLAAYLPALYLIVYVITAHWLCRYILDLTSLPVWTVLPGWRRCLWGPGLSGYWIVFMGFAAFAYHTIVLWVIRRRDNIPLLIPVLLHGAFWFVALNALLTTAFVEGVFVMR